MVTWHPIDRAIGDGIPQSRRVAVGVAGRQHPELFADALGEAEGQR